MESLSEAYVSEVISSDKHKQSSQQLCRLNHMCLVDYHFERGSSDLAYMQLKI